MTYRSPISADQIIAAMEKMLNAELHSDQRRTVREIYNQVQRDFAQREKDLQDKTKVERQYERLLKAAENALAPMSAPIEEQATVLWEHYGGGGGADDLIATLHYTTGLIQMANLRTIG